MHHIRFTALAFVIGAAALVAQDAAKPTDPVLIRQVEPSYTSAALRQRIAGKVALEIVVLEDGTVGDARVTRSLDDKLGLDAEAVKAVKKWLFKPATIDGKAVAKTISVETTFNIHTPPEVAIGVADGDPFAKDVHRLNEPGLSAPGSMWTPGWPAGPQDLQKGPEIPIDLVVLADGTVGRARPARIQGAAGTGVIPPTDAALANALKDWRFRPATINGQPVPVLIRVRCVVPK